MLKLPHQKLEQNFHCTSAHILTISCLATCVAIAWLFLEVDFSLYLFLYQKRKSFFCLLKCHVCLMDVSEITFEDTAAQLKISWKFE